MANPTEAAQIMRIGNGVLIALNHPIEAAHAEQLREHWNNLMPDVPSIFLSGARIIEGDAQLMIDLGDGVTPEIVEEFKRWWEEVGHG